MRLPPALLQRILGSFLISGGLFHPIYAIRRKWFRGVAELFRRPDRDETIAIAANGSQRQRLPVARIEP
jgi:hypothetical protein